MASFFDGSEHRDDDDDEVADDVDDDSEDVVMSLKLDEQLFESTLWLRDGDDGKLSRSVASLINDITNFLFFF